MKFRWGGWAAVVGLALLAIPLLRYQSISRTVLDRWSLPYFLFLCLYMAGILTVVFLCFSSERRYRAVFNANLVVLAISVLVALGAGELIAHRALKNQYQRFPANFVTRSRTAEYDVEMRINSRGFRDREHKRRKAPGVRRIAVIGDSFVWGSGVRFADTFAARIDSLLNEGREPKRTEVLSYGVSGTGPSHYLKVFRGAVRPYKPDVVVVCFYAGNDLKDVLTEAKVRVPRPALPTLVRGVVRPWRPKPNSDGWNPMGAECPATMENLLRSGRLRGVPADSVRARLAAVPETLVRDAQAFRSNPFNLAEAVLDPDAIRKNLLEGETMERAWPLAGEALAGLDREIRRSGARMLLAVIPAGVQVDTKYWDYSSQIGFQLDGRMLTSSPLQDRLAEFGAAHGIEVIDLLPVFRAHPDETLYYMQDGHWNPAGHLLAAQTVVEALRDGAR